MFSAAEATARYQPRPGDAPHDLFQSRLAVCQACNLRSAHRCLAARQLVTVLARPAAALCPNRSWPGDPPLPPQAWGRPVARAPAPLAEVRTLQALTTFFNPQDDPRLDENYQRFAAGLEAAGVPLWTIELAFDADPFRLPPAPRQVRVRGSRHRNLLWQKERLLNILLDYVPGDVEGILWIDADVEFLNPRWTDDTRSVLGSHQVAQLFQDCYQVEPGGNLEHVGPSTGSFYAGQGKAALPHFGPSHSGFAWGARAAWLRAIGFEDTVVTSWGDTVMARAFTGTPQDAEISAGWQAHLACWSAAARQAVRGSFTFVPGSIRHLWHGPLVNRDYPGRRKALIEHGFDPATDLELDSQRLWAWSERALAEKPAMVASVKQYFSVPIPG